MKILNKVKVLLMALALVCSMSALAVPAFADNEPEGARLFVKNENAEKAGFSKVTEDGDGTTSSLMKSVFGVINFALGAIGVLSVVMVIFGGFQYTISAGDSGKVTKAKNTILYGVIGLVIAMLAWAIVNFVITKVAGV